MAEFCEVGVDDRLVKSKFKKDEEILEMKYRLNILLIQRDLSIILINLLKSKDKFDYLVI